MPDKNTKFIIKGGKQLSGEVRVSGSKHSALAILYAAAALPITSTISNMPLELADIQTTLRILAKLGTDIKINAVTKTVTIRGPIKNNKVPVREVKKMRLSLLLLSVGITNFQTLTFPREVGGCKIGTRKIDQHLYVLAQLGIQVHIRDGKIILNRKGRLYGSKIHFDIQSTSATENAIIASVFSNSTKVDIHNAHLRPEIIDLLNFLRKAGVKIEFDPNSNSISIYPTQEFREKVDYKIMGDLDEAFTYVVAAQLTKSNIKITGVDTKEIEEEIKVLKSIGLKLKIRKKSITCIPVPENLLKSFNIEVGPYPKFGSDRNPLIASLASIINGESKIIDRRFPERTEFHSQLTKLGCKIESKEEGINIIHGSSETLRPNKVKATDIRGGAAMILLGLRFHGTTIIKGIYPITRGYESIEKKLQTLGAEIVRV